jgi:hypothetical protein
MFLRGVDQDPMLLPSKIFLYDDRIPPNVSVEAVKRRLLEFLGETEILERGEFISHHTASLQGEGKERVIAELAQQLASIRVRDPWKESSFSEPAYGEIQYEKRRITDTRVQSHGILYDGFELARLLDRLIPSEERSLSKQHIVLTNQLFGTWGEDRRYHYRVSVYSRPCLISTTGVVEAPAKPREFYIEKQSIAALGLRGGSLEALKQKYAGEFIDHGDERMTEVLVGYSLQAVLYAATGNPFCPEPSCRFYDAHRQADLIGAQLEGEEFCEGHRALLDQLGRNPHKGS